ncbi:MAG: TetR family transcriptional regulator [Solirubrobacterales bacterium]|nr:TetR family transcriptional regulator [Solirubrobacterales bacterium]
MSSTETTRRTQEQRREETRGKLLDATITSLVEVGYSATTTRRVAELAGVSVGAQSHHFPHRVDLLAAAVEHLAERRVRELREVSAALPDDLGERAAVCLDLLWADFSSPLFSAFVKLWVAAADDPELFARLAPIEVMMVRSIRELSVEIVGAPARSSDFQARLSVVLSTIRGLALTQAFEPTGRRRSRDPWPVHRAALERLLLVE